MKISENLPHELAFFIENIKELWLLTVSPHSFYRNCELSDHDIGIPTKHFGFSVNDSDPHIRLKNKFLLKLHNFISLKHFPDRIPSF